MISHYTLNDRNKFGSQSIFPNKIVQVIPCQPPKNDMTVEGNKLYYVITQKHNF